MLTVDEIARVDEMLEDTDHLSLAPHHGKKMVIFFFPRADTSGCRRESLLFSNLIRDFADSGVAN